MIYTNDQIDKNMLEGKKQCFVFKFNYDEPKFVLADSLACAFCILLEYCGANNALFRDVLKRYERPSELIQLFNTFVDDSDYEIEFVGIVSEGHQAADMEFIQ